MANSVSKINVVVGAQTGQLQSGMRQAAATVQEGMGNVQSIAQQATFAVDDFFAAFSTGGVAGGLRGAGNNLTMIAASLGGIKTQLLVIAGLSVAQLIAKNWEQTGEAVETVNRALERFQEILNRGSAVGGAQQNMREQLRGIAGERSINEVFIQRAEGRTALQDLKMQLSAERKRLADLRQLAASVVGEGAAEKVRDEIVEREKAARVIRDQIREQEKLNQATERQLQLLQRERGNRLNVGAAGGAGGLLAPRVGAMAEVADIDKEIQQLRERMRASVSIADVFRMMPGVNSMGSAGAVGAINAAMAGPMNARDSGPALARETNNILKRIEELEKKKKGLVEVVGL